MEAVVLAAGEGRRLRPLTERWPKPILPIDGKPVIVTLLGELEAAGVGEVTVVVGHLGEQIRNLLDGFGVRFAEQPEAVGSAHALRRAVGGGAPAPFELQTAFARARAAGPDVVSVELGPIRSLTEPADVVKHNFVYLGD